MGRFTVETKDGEHLRNTSFAACAMGAPYDPYYGAMRARKARRAIDDISDRKDSLGVQGDKETGLLEADGANHIRHRGELWRESLLSEVLPLEKASTEITNGNKIDALAHVEDLTFGFVNIRTAKSQLCKEPVASERCPETGRGILSSDNRPPTWLLNLREGYIYCRLMSVGSKKGSPSSISAK